ncbi:hypothetical protein KR009_006245 [Drosophila setifemur]|nr:hypothetical protein KR009_006245 [Drosophila setifemur]
MASKVKKDVICDYCGGSNDTRHIYSAQKSFVGRKVLELLEVITHRGLPSNVGLKICFLCCSTLMSTVGIIEKTKILVIKSISEAESKKKGAKLQQSSGEVEKDENKADEDTLPGNKSNLVDLTSDCEAPEAVKPAAATKKNTTIRQRSKSVAFPSNPIYSLEIQSPAVGSPKKKLKQSTLVDGSLSKLSPMRGNLNDSVKPTPQKQATELNDSVKLTQPATELNDSVHSTSKSQATVLETNLNDSVKLTPAKEIPTKKKVFLQLFGTTNGEDHTKESDEEEPDNPTVQVVPNIFECKLCDFRSKFPKQFKDHMTGHGHRRPRIYNCDNCSKSFGILKSLKVHLSTAHGITLETSKQVDDDEKGKTKGSNPKEANAKKVVLKKAKANEAISHLEKSKEDSSEQDKPEEIDHERSNKEGSVPAVASFKALNESTVKKKALENEANVDLTFAVNGTSASTPIEIQKPKIFQCPICEKILSTKQTLKIHMNLHQEGMAETKRKILQEEGDNVNSSEQKASDKGPIEKAAEEIEKEQEPENAKIQKSKAFKCHICDKYLSAKQSLNRHLMRHNEVSKQEELYKKKAEEEKPQQEESFSIDVNNLPEMATKNDVSLSSPAVSNGDSPNKTKRKNKLSQSQAGNESFSNDVNEFLVPKPKKVKKEAGALDASPSSSAVSNVDSPNKKKRKHKLDKSKAGDETELTETYLSQGSLVLTPKQVKNEAGALDASLSSSAISNGDSPNKSKRKQKLSKSTNEEELEDSFLSQVSQLDEINPNVRPHKKARLESIGADSTLDITTGDEVDFSCDKCGKNLMNRLRLESHMQRKHDAKLKCPLCKSSHNGQLQYVAHFAECSGNAGALPCGVAKCKKSFADANYLSSHLRKRHQWA